MTHWMMETLVWTAVLIAFVLLVRRPVSRSFGPQIAYALWALPALRLVLPPLELPAWMRLTPEQAPAATQATSEEFLVTAFEAPPAHVESATGVDPTRASFDVTGVAATDAAPVLTDAPMTVAAGINFDLLLQLGGA